MKQDIQPYLDVIEKFRRKEISIEDFEEKYLYLFKAEKRILPKNVFLLLNEIFTSIDMHVLDKYGYPITVDELDDAMLTKRVNEIYVELLSV